ncbi:flavorubredoxin [Desulfosalsimonas propionicica]|uniref:Flavorubredoxin n=1 Tax=Desulfosalsimonas propionicica TaxID=332175 RepID=A0A7W0CB43_9BACT|nr:flavodoxin domain-containing protein [Desulfosalsimonas propionicica]MBA2882414.1 flavorubredoxin [Desulfosalsimonas propionicica]
MKILHLYYTSTGNTRKVAETIDNTLQDAGHQVDSVKVDKNTQADINVLDYDMVFAGSGVYEWLPGKSMQELFGRLRRQHAENGDIKPASPKRPGKSAVIYCTYGGVHTGINEAIPAVKYMGQLFDHLGFTILAEWYVPGQYVPEKMQKFSEAGRMGDIRGRPDASDLNEVAEKTKGILQV